MDYIDKMRKLQELHQEIRKGHTGNLTTLAERMHEDKATVKRRIAQLQSEGAKIEFDRQIKSYRYTNNFNLQVIITYDDIPE